MGANTLGLILSIIRYVRRWGHPTRWAFEWSRGGHGEVHHQPESSRDVVPVCQLELQRHQHHHLHQHQHQRAGIRHQDLTGPSHRGSGAPEPGAGGQRGVRCHHHTRWRAAETGEHHTHGVRWVECPCCFYKNWLELTFYKPVYHLVLCSHPATFPELQWFCF